MRTAEGTTAPEVPSRPGPASTRRARVVIRRVGPWSVLRFSLLFYFCVMLILWLALMILYGIMGSLGVLAQIARLLESVSLVDEGFRFNGAWIFSRLFVVGLGLVALWSVINLFVAFLYNLVSDVVGGIEVTLAERR
ncbi:MAG TPA: DUF3566 domain-containing protein [Actinomycetota bacterium]|nr:DUF3566 domain-containing protein [Actinomycetota bacterium]